MQLAGKLGATSLRQGWWVPYGSFDRHARQRTPASRGEEDLPGGNASLDHGESHGCSVGAGGAQGSRAAADLKGACPSALTEWNRALPDDFFAHAFSERTSPKPGKITAIDLHRRMA